MPTLASTGAPNAGTKCTYLQSVTPWSHSQLNLLPGLFRKEGQDGRYAHTTPSPGQRRRLGVKGCWQEGGRRGERGEEKGATTTVAAATAVLAADAQAASTAARDSLQSTLAPSSARVTFSSARNASTSSRSAKPNVRSTYSTGKTGRYLQQDRMRAVSRNTRKQSSRFEFKASPGQLTPHKEAVKQGWLTEKS